MTEDTAEQEYVTATGGEWGDEAVPALEISCKTAGEEADDDSGAKPLGRVLSKGAGTLGSTS